MTFEELCEANRRRRADAELADLPLLAHARTDDPATSHEAAASVKGMRESHAAILRTFKRYGPMTDEEMIELYRTMPTVPRQSVSGLRTRRHELAVAGKLRDTGKREPMASGRQAIVWGLA